MVKRKLPASSSSSSASSSSSCPPKPTCDSNVRKFQAKASSNNKLSSLTLDQIKLSTVLPSEYPLSEFLSNDFRKKAVHVTGAPPPKSLLSAMHDLDVKEIYDTTSSDNVFVWIKDPSGSGKLNSIEISDPKSAETLYNAGHATYCRAPPEVEQKLVFNFLTELGIGAGQYDPSGDGLGGLEGRGEVETFCGSEKHYTDWHFDFQENFTFQLSGTKLWRLAQGPVKHPLRGTTPHYLAPAAVESQLKSVSQP